MAQEYFKNFPEMQYTLSDGKIITIKDFFRKSKIEQEAVTGLIDYTLYELLEGDRPDTVATRLYGQGDLHWTFYLVNDFDNYFDWFKSSLEFETYMGKKYEGVYCIAPNSTDLVNYSSGVSYKFLLGETVTTSDSEGIVTEVDPLHKRLGIKVLKGDFQSGAVSSAQSVKDTSNNPMSFTPVSTINKRDGVCYYYKGTLRKNQFENGYTAKSFYEEEYEKNEEKRRIKIIKPARLGKVVSEFERVMKS